MLTLIKPDHFYQMRYDFLLIGNIFFLYPKPEFPCAGSGFWSWLWHVIRPKQCSGFTLFQKETSFGYDLSSNRLFTRCHLDLAHPDKQHISSSWILDTEGRSDGLHPYACFTFHFDFNDAPIFKGWPLNIIYDVLEFVNSVPELCLFQTIILLWVGRLQM